MDMINLGTWLLTGFIFGLGMGLGLATTGWIGTQLTSPRQARNRYR